MPYSANTQPQLSLFSGALPATRMAALQNCPVLSLIFSNLVPPVIWVQWNLQRLDCHLWPEMLCSFSSSTLQSSPLAQWEHLPEIHVYIYIKCRAKLIFVLGTKPSPVIQKSPHQLHFMATLRVRWWVRCWRFRKQGRVLWLPITRLHCTPSSARV